MVQPSVLGMQGGGEDRPGVGKLRVLPGTYGNSEVIPDCPVQGAGRMPAGGTGGLE